MSKLCGLFSIGTLLALLSLPVLPAGARASSSVLMRGPKPAPRDGVPCVSPSYSSERFTIFVGKIESVKSEWACVGMDDGRHYEIEFADQEVLVGAEPPKTLSGYYADWELEHRGAHLLEEGKEVVVWMTVWSTDVIHAEYIRNPDSVGADIDALSAIRHAPGANHVWGTLVTPGSRGSLTGSVTYLSSIDSLSAPVNSDGSFYLGRAKSAAGNLILRLDGGWTDGRASRDVSLSDSCLPFAIPLGMPPVAPPELDTNLQLRGIGLFDLISAGYHHENRFDLEYMLEPPPAKVFRVSLSDLRSGIVMYRHLPAQLRLVEETEDGVTRGPWLLIGVEDASSRVSGEFDSLELYLRE